jgi:hypothetical protein
MFVFPNRYGIIKTTTTATSFMERSMIKQLKRVFEEVKEMVCESLQRERAHIRWGSCPLMSLQELDTWRSEPEKGGNDVL